MMLVVTLGGGRGAFKRMRTNLDLGTLTSMATKADRGSGTSGRSSGSARSGGSARSAGTGRPSDRSRREVSASPPGAASDAVRARLREAGVRYTTARQELLDALVAAGQPLTADEIRNAAAVPVSSLYRNLAVLEEAGLVHRLAGPGDFARFEPAEGLLEHHHHLACIRCGALVDVHLPTALESELDRQLHRIARRRGFTVDSHRLDVMGVCPRCSAEQGGKP